MGDVLYVPYVPKCSTQPLTGESEGFTTQTGCPEGGWQILKGLTGPPRVRMESLGQTRSREVTWSFVRVASGPHKAVWGVQWG